MLTIKLLWLLFIIVYHSTIIITVAYSYDDRPTDCCGSARTRVCYEFVVFFFPLRFLFRHRRRTREYDRSRYHLPKQKHDSSHAHTRTTLSSEYWLGAHTHDEHTHTYKYTHARPGCVCAGAFVVLRHVHTHTHIHECAHALLCACATFDRIIIIYRVVGIRDDKNVFVRWSPNGNVGQATLPHFAHGSACVNTRRTTDLIATIVNNTPQSPLRGGAEGGGTARRFNGSHARRSDGILGLLGCYRRDRSSATANVVHVRR